MASRRILTRSSTTGHRVNIDPLPIVTQIVLVLEKLESAVGIAIRDEEQDSVSRLQDAVRLGHELGDVRLASRQDGIQGSLADNQIKGLVVKRECLGHVGTAKAKGRRMVSLLQLVQDHGRKVEVSNPARPSILQHVVSQGGIATTEQENTALRAGWEILQCLLLLLFLYSVRGGAVVVMTKSGGSLDGKVGRMEQGTETSIIAVPFAWGTVVMIINE